MRADRSGLDEPLREGKATSDRMSCSEREAVFRSEREATRLDASNPLAQAEAQEWEATLEDGID
jgi:hypothetical protein